MSTHTYPTPAQIPRSAACAGTRRIAPVYHLSDDAPFLRAQRNPRTETGKSKDASPLGPGRDRVRHISRSSSRGKGKDVSPLGSGRDSVRPVSRSSSSSRGKPSSDIPTRSSRSPSRRPGKTALLPPAKTCTSTATLVENINRKRSPELLDGSLAPRLHPHERSSRWANYHSRHLSSNGASGSSGTAGAGKSRAHTQSPHFVSDIPKENLLGLPDWRHEPILAKPDYEAPKSGAPLTKPRGQLSHIPLAVRTPSKTHHPSIMQPAKHFRQERASSPYEPDAVAARKHSAASTSALHVSRPFRPPMNRAPSDEELSFSHFFRTAASNAEGFLDKDDGSPIFLDSSFAASLNRMDDPFSAAIGLALGFGRDLTPPDIQQGDACCDVADAMMSIPPAVLVSEQHGIIVDSEQSDGKR